MTAKKNKTPLMRRRPRDLIEAELADLSKSVGRLREELAEHDYCACGALPLFMGKAPVLLEDGWRHATSECQPPTPEAKRCQCGYAIIREGRDAWSCASYSSGDDRRKPLLHTDRLCYEYND